MPTARHSSLLPGPPSGLRHPGTTVPAGAGHALRRPRLHAHRPDRHLGPEPPGPPRRRRRDAAQPGRSPSHTGPADARGHPADVREAGAAVVVQRQQQPHQHGPDREPLRARSTIQFGLDELKDFGLLEECVELADLGVGDLGGCVGDRPGPALSDLLRLHARAHQLDDPRRPQPAYRHSGQIPRPPVDQGPGANQVLRVLDGPPRPEQGRPHLNRSRHGRRTRRPRAPPVHPAPCPRRSGPRAGRVARRPCATAARRRSDDADRCPGWPRPPSASAPDRHPAPATPARRSSAAETDGWPSAAGPPTRQQCRAVADWPRRASGPETPPRAHAPKRRHVIALRSHPSHGRQHSSTP